MTAVMTAPTAKAKKWKWNAFTREGTMQTVACLLWTLHELGGEITDVGGRCGYQLVAEARKRGYIPNHIHDPFVGKVSTGSLSQLLHELEVGNYAGTISRDCNGKRTYKIKLLLSEDQLPPKPHPVVVKKVEPAKPQGDAVKPQGAAVKPKIGDTRPAPEPVRIQPAKAVAPPAPPVAPAAVNDSEAVETVNLPKGLDIAPPISEPPAEPVLPPLVMVEGNAVDILLQIQQLAMQATLVVATDIGGGPVVESEDRDAIAERLAQTLEENNRLRRKVNDSTETMRAKAKEIEALRKALTIAQNNIKAMQDAYAGSTDIERNLARLKGNQRFIASRPEAAIAARS